MHLVRSVEGDGEPSVFESWFEVMASAHREVARLRGLIAAEEDERTRALMERRKKALLGGIRLLEDRAKVTRALGGR